MAVFINHAKMKPFSLAEHPNIDAKLEALIIHYVQSLPVKNAFLFRYSPLCMLGEGLLSYENQQINFILDIRDYITIIPAVHQAIHSLTAIYLTKKQFLQQVGNKYLPLLHNRDHLVILPIHYRSVVFGYIISNQFAKDTVFNQDFLSPFQIFGRQAGHYLYGSTQSVKNPLSKREYDVMALLADGYVIKEIQAQINISESTIKQYIQSTIKKLKVNNRTQAIAHLIREGILS